MLRRFAPVILVVFTVLVAGCTHQKNYADATTQATAKKTTPSATAEAPKCGCSQKQKTPCVKK